MLENSFEQGYFNTFKKAFMNGGITEVRNKYNDLKFRWNSSLEDYHEKISLIDGVYKQFLVSAFIEQLQKEHKKEGNPDKEIKYKELATEIEELGIYKKFKKTIEDGYFNVFLSSFERDGIKGVRDKSIELKSCWDSKSKDYPEKMSLIKDVYEYFLVIKFIRELQDAYQKDGSLNMDDKYRELGTQIKNSGIYNTQEVDRIRLLLEKSKDFMNSYTLRSQVSEMDDDKVFRIFRSIMLDDKTRKYDKSKLFDEHLIGIINENGYRKRAVWEKKPDKTLKGKTIVDNFGRSITITPIGGIIFKNPSGLENSVIKYSITKKISEDNFDVWEVYSDIKFSLLGYDTEYTEAVVTKLLSDKNIKLSNVDGYIGKLERIDQLETSTPQDFVDNVSSNWVLHFDREQLSAVGIIERNLQVPKEEPLKGEKRFVNLSDYFFDRKFGLMDPNEMSATEFLDKYTDEGVEIDG